jgi:hypothetical protein
MKVSKSCAMAHTRVAGTFFFSCKTAEVNSRLFAFSLCETLYHPEKKQSRGLLNVHAARISNLKKGGDFLK